MAKQFLLLFTLSYVLFASNDAESLYFKNACNSCHGMYAEGMGTAPRLQGQKPVERQSTCWRAVSSHEYHCRVTGPAS